MGHFTGRTEYFWMLLATSNSNESIFDRHTQTNNVKETNRYIYMAKFSIVFALLAIHMMHIIWVRMFFLMEALSLLCEVNSESLYITTFEDQCTFILFTNINHHHKHQVLDPLIRSVSRVKSARANASSVFRLFSFLVVCSGMISKGFGFVAFFASVKASSVCIHLSCLVCL